MQLVKFCHQIAKGMTYISDKGIIHRDLAARNCMYARTPPFQLPYSSIFLRRRVNWDLQVKVADFGLSRAIKEGKDYYRMCQGGKLPVRWMSPESLLDFVFSEQSDVVSIFDRSICVCSPSFDVVVVRSDDVGSDDACYDTLSRYIQSGRGSLFESRQAP